MAASTRLTLTANTPLNNLMAIAAAKLLDAQAAIVRAKSLADSITASGVTKTNLEITGGNGDVANGEGTAYYDLIAAAKANADSACTELKKIDQGVVV